MVTIFEKYEKIRPELRAGDIILFHGTGFIAKVIQWGDRSRSESKRKAYYNHVGVIIECEGALGICDANGDGVQWDRLSWRIRKYKRGGDFTIIRPLAGQTLIEAQLRQLLKRSDSKWVKYDFWNGIKELANRRWGWNLKIIVREEGNKYICSTNDATYVMNLEMVNHRFGELRIQFPEDYIRYINWEKAKMIC